MIPTVLRFFKPGRLLRILGQPFSRMVLAGPFPMTEKRLIAMAKSSGAFPGEGTVKTAFGRAFFFETPFTRSEIPLRSAVETSFWAVAEVPLGAAIEISPWAAVKVSFGAMSKGRPGRAVKTFLPERPFGRLSAAEQKIDLLFEVI